MALYRGYEFSQPIVADVEVPIKRTPRGMRRFTWLEMPILQHISDLNYNTHGVIITPDSILQLCMLVSFKKNGSIGKISPRLLRVICTAQVCINPPNSLSFAMRLHAQYKQRLNPFTSSETRRRIRALHPHHLKPQSRAMRNQCQSLYHRPGYPLTAIKLLSRCGRCITDELMAREVDWIGVIVVGDYVVADTATAVQELCNTPRYREILQILAAMPVVLNPCLVEMVATDYPSLRRRYYEFIIHVAAKVCEDGNAANLTLRWFNIIFGHELLVEFMDTVRYAKTRTTVSLLLFQKYQQIIEKGWAVVDVTGIRMQRIKDTTILSRHTQRTAMFYLIPRGLQWCIVQSDYLNVLKALNQKTIVKIYLILAPYLRTPEAIAGIMSHLPCENATVFERAEYLMWTDLPLQGTLILVGNLTRARTGVAWGAMKLGSVFEELVMRSLTQPTIVRVPIGPYHVCTLPNAEAHQITRDECVAWDNLNPTMEFFELKVDQGNVF